MKIEEAKEMIESWRDDYEVWWTRNDNDSNTNVMDYDLSERFAVATGEAWMCEGCGDVSEDFDLPGMWQDSEGVKLCPKCSAKKET